MSLNHFIHKALLISLVSFSAWGIELDPPAQGCGSLALVGAHSTPIPTKAPVIIFSGPSGAGKTTVLQKLLQSKEIPLRTAVAVTTRAPRPGELDGVHYHFWTKEKYQEALTKGEFLESADVHGNSYGTLRSEVEPFIAKGTGVVLVIDVQGAAKIQEIYPESVSIFLKTSSIETYEKRLRSRGTETEEAIQKRIKNAREELKHESLYQHTVLNDDLNTAVSDLSTLIKKKFSPKP